jgi:hypothetical protein
VRTNPSGLKAVVSPEATCLITYTIDWRGKAVKVSLCTLDAVHKFCFVRRCRINVHFLGNSLDLVRVHGVPPVMRMIRTLTQHE